jgi:hypothetical protein
MSLPFWRCVCDRFLSHLPSDPSQIIFFTCPLHSVPQIGTLLKLRCDRFYVVYPTPDQIGYPCQAVHRGNHDGVTCPPKPIEIWGVTQIVLAAALWLTDQKFDIGGSHRC